jgi:hypothetical protein
VALKLQFENHDIFNQGGVWKSDLSSFWPAKSANAISVIEKPPRLFLGKTWQTGLAYKPINLHLNQELIFCESITIKEMGLVRSQIIA